MNMQYDYTLYFMNPEDGLIYQYVYKDLEKANREYKQCIEADYSCTLLASLTSYKRKVDDRIMKTKGNC